ncbi:MULTISPECIES: trans-aconitate 2-methyltransferase [unclassified Pseudomonas]|uniref:trans-aconitate 2-methyltransferase n=1 Tax=unclassified Pseudomonas TaxID=196821 RepID=UPI000C884DBB|nr:MULTISPECIES: trans-aconitate 2-methyltransferase [unclassified Pseudomonas]PMX24524.1 trans-aconitate 2-methyltransferase [Pseudomonas sp. GW460-12]PMX34826.1 trans-aconitate 2-methyltransferase [Pseudomonas sp. MPR-R2A4]PMX41465.1 trans-aconitate 2-methyltransferase [Pseudomonas sp. MPR-R2A7]PMX53982.1 trans-aconitate 2-methyltransferase [Pseudomonas sp. MPR-R2A6]PMX90943.1 trans-aconitate 2-methyltransferase [Pseudomonas sp. MPR-R2A3]
MTWSAKQYTMFEQQRTRPVRDLVAAIPNTEVRTAVDLGCGPGNSTEVLAGRFPQAQVTGMDSSDDMLVDARKRLPGLNFERADIGAWSPEHAFDVILANASLQWLPDHATLYPHLVNQLTPGGTLAVQTPDNLDEPAHRLAREVAADGPWSAKIGAVKHHERHTASYYYELLSQHCSVVDVWRTTYLHPLADHAAVVEWFKGSALRPFLAPLSDGEKAAFLREYQARITQAYPALGDGTVLLPFPRLFVIATR